MRENHVPPVGLLGPQRHTPTLAGVVSELGLTGDLAVVTAGWQEREHEATELDEHLRGRVVHLELHARAEDAFDRDPELATAHRERQRTLRGMQELYALRLEAALRVVFELFRRTPDDSWVEDERGAALEAVRELDRRHLSRIDEVRVAFEARYRPGERDAILHHRRELARALQGAAALAIAGGHVAVLINRLRLFGLDEWLGRMPVVAWSGGAMVACERIVLFHDHPPHGPGYPEVLDRGLGAAPGLVALPHARRRLDLEDRIRVELMARRFAPALCVALDDGASLVRRDGAWQASEGCARLTASGGLEPVPALSPA